MPKKVLVISYYWPPSGGGGVQRWLKFVKYLPQFGWTPVVFTPENPDFELQDSTLDRDVDANLDVIRFPIWEPFGIYKKLTGANKNGSYKQGIVIEKSNMSLMQRLVIWIRGNLFLPDPRRFWVKPSVKFLVDYLEREQVDAVVTTGPPHSMHLIGMGLKQKTGVKWIADFRDPWSDWDLLDKLKTSSLAKKWHKYKESQVLKIADVILTCTPRMASLFQAKGYTDKVKMITNGVDASDFDIEDEPSFDKFRITHIGLLNEMRNPVALWQVLAELVNEREDFREDLEIELAGMVSSSVLDGINSSTLSKHLSFLDYIPHKEVFTRYQQASLLLLLMNDSDNADILIPGKFFEYLYTSKRILAFGSKRSDVNTILMDSGMDTVVDYSDKTIVKSRVLETYEKFKLGQVDIPVINKEQWLRSNLTKQLKVVLDGLS